MRLPIAGSLALVLALGALAPARVQACSGDVPVRHQLAFTADGALLAHADPSHRVVRVDGSSTRELTLPPMDRTPMQARAFAPDGRTMLVAVDDYADEERGAACMATFVHLTRVDLATGTLTPLRRLRSAGVDSIEISPDSRLALVMAQDFGGEPVVHLFDLTRGERVRVTRDARAWFLDAATLLVLGEDASLRVASVADGRTVARVPAPPPDERRRLLPGSAHADAFTLVLERDGEAARLVDARVVGRRVALTPWSWRPRGTPIAASADGTRIVLHAGRRRWDESFEGRVVRVVDRASGAEALRMSTAYRYTAAALAPDGRSLALVSVPRPRTDPDQPYDVHAELPTTIERIDLTTGARVAWGEASPSTLERTP